MQNGLDPSNLTHLCIGLNKIQYLMKYLKGINICQILHLSNTKMAIMQVSFTDFDLNFEIVDESFTTHAIL